VEEVKEQLPKLKRNYLPAQKQQIRKELLIGHEHNNGSLNRKRLCLSQVSAWTRVKIVQMAAAKIRTHKEIGELFNVSISTVKQLSSAVKRSKSTIVKRRTQELKRSHDQIAIISVVSRMISERRSIWSAKQLQDLVKE
jgi:hypothetical protein